MGAASHNQQVRLCFFSGLAHYFGNVATANEYLRFRAQFLLNLSHLFRRGTDKFLFHFRKNLIPARAIDLDSGCDVSKRQLSTEFGRHILRPTVWSLGCGS